MDMATDSVYAITAPIKRTYGRPKPTLLAAETSFSSDLTHLSQLSGHVSSDASMEYEQGLVNVNTFYKPTLHTRERENGEAAYSSEADDSGYGMPERKSIADILANCDEEFDNEQDEGVSAILSAHLQLPVPSVEQLEKCVLTSPSRPAIPISLEQNNITLASSPHQSDDNASFPILPTNTCTYDEDKDDDESDHAQDAWTRTLKTKKQAIIDSDEDTLSPIPATTNTHVPSVKIHKGAILSDSDDEVKATSLQRVYPDSDQDEEEEEEEVNHVKLATQEIQETEEIEQYKASQTEPRTKTKRLTKAQQEQVHRTSESMIRSQSVWIEKRSRKARPLSEIAARLRGKEAPSALAFQINSTSINKTSFSISEVSRNRLPSHHHHSLSTSSRRSLSLVASSARPKSQLEPRKPITIGSSSAIFDTPCTEDSYDPSYLESQSQSQSQSQIEGNSQDQIKPISPIEVGQRQQDAKKVEEEEEEELLDVSQMIEREKKAQALKQKKAALLLRQQVLEDEKREKKSMNGKGKGRAIVSQQGIEISPSDSDSDDDLEICLPRLVSPKIEFQYPRTHNSHFSMAQKKIQALVPKREREHSITVHGGGDEITTDSQFHQAGRTFGRGDARTIVDPHVAMNTKLGKSKSGNSNRNSGTTAHAGTKMGGVSKKAQDKLLLQKASKQAREDTLRRVEDWQKRGGTLRHQRSIGITQSAEFQQDEGKDNEEVNQQERAKDLMESMRVEAERAAANEQDAGIEDGDDADDEDFVGSGEEEENDNEDEEEEYGSIDEMGSMDGMDGMDLDEASTSEAELEEARNDDKEAEFNSEVSSSPVVVGQGSNLIDTNTTVRLSSQAPGEANNLTEYDNHDDESDIRRPQTITSRPRLIASITDDEGKSLKSSPTLDKPKEVVAATQYHSFIVKEQAAFPHFDPSKMAEISLTQAFGNPEDSQPIPQASRAVFEQGAGFSQFFDEEGLVDSQVLPTQTQMPVLQKPLPKMFQKDGDSCDLPELKRHIIGEAPMILDAALRDAEIREEAERAHYEIQQRKARANAEKEARANMLTTTPGSTLSDDIMLPPVSDLILRFDDRDTQFFDDGESNADNEMHQSIVKMIPSSEGGAIDSQESPLAPRGRLVRANEKENRQSSPAASWPPNAFDRLRQGQLRLAKPKEKRKKSDYIAEQADESEEETPFAALRKAADGDDEDNDSDLDGSVESLVDDEAVPEDQREEQDKLAMEKHQEQLAADEERLGKRVDKIVAGQERKRKTMDGDLLSDSDYEDDEAGLHRQAKPKKSRKFGKPVEALAANEKTVAFADALKDDKPDSQEAAESQYLIDETEEQEDDDGENYQRERLHHRHQRSIFRTTSPDVELKDITHMIWHPQSSPVMDLNINDKLAFEAARPAAKIDAEDFADLDDMYSQKETLGFARKTIILDKEDSQNDRGIGPGRTSAVTSFVQRNQVGKQAMKSKQSSHIAVSNKIMSLSRMNNVSSLNSTKLVNGQGKGRLAMARLTSRNVQ